MDTTLLLPISEGLANLFATWFLVKGRLAIGRGDRVTHIWHMKRAVLCGIVFLVVFVARQGLVAPRTVLDPSWLRSLYLGIMIVHIPAATILPFFAVPTLWFAWKGQFERHKPLARILWPIWIASNITGVISLVIVFVWGVVKA